MNWWARWVPSPTASWKLTSPMTTNTRPIIITITIVIIIGHLTLNSILQPSIVWISVKMVNNEMTVVKSSQMKQVPFLEEYTYNMVYCGTYYLGHMLFYPYLSISIDKRDNRYCYTTPGIRAFVVSNRTDLNKCHVMTTFYLNNR